VVWIVVGVLILGWVVSVGVVDVVELWYVVVVVMWFDEVDL